MIIRIQIRIKTIRTETSKSSMVFFITIIHTNQEDKAFENIFLARYAIINCY